MRFIIAGLLWVLLAVLACQDSGELGDTVADTEFVVSNYTGEDLLGQFCGPVGVFSIPVDSSVTVASKSIVFACSPAPLSSIACFAIYRTSPMQAIYIATDTVDTRWSRNDLPGCRFRYELSLQPQDLLKEPESVCICPH